MFLFSRQIQTRGDVRKVAPWATQMCELVNRKSELDVSLWATVYGAPLGTIAFTTLVQSQTSLEAGSASLILDDEYLDHAVAGEDFVIGSPEDALVEIIHTSGGEYRRADVGSVANLTTAVVSPGKYGAAGIWAVEIADLPSIVGTATAGQFGTLAWVSTVPDMAASDQAAEQLNKDPRYLQKLDEISGLFVEGTGLRVISRRIA
jgi:hypothetical protein